MLTMKPADAQRFFFDRKIVQKGVDKATRRVLSKFGAFVRQRARTSMRRRKKIAEAGQAPSAHVGKVKELLFFAWDPTAKSVVIGPALLNGRRQAGPTIPELLEEGGDIEAVRVDPKTGRRRRMKLHYEPHPFMGPAAKEEQARLPPLWANSVRH